MKKQIALIILLMLILVGLSGCTYQENNQTTDNEWKIFAGTWKYSNIGSLHMGASTYTFFSDGTCSVPFIITMSGIWEVKDDKLVIEIPSESLISVFYYSFSNNYQNLTLTNVDSNNKTLLIKQ